jgi:hypothetical protein
MSMCEWSDVTWNCLDEQTEILTKNGWKKYNEINKNDKVYSLNPKNQELELKNINKIFIYDYNGSMIKYNNDNRINFCVTSNHKFLIRYSRPNRNKERLEYLEISKFPKGDNRYFFIGSEGYEGNFKDLTDNQIKMIGWIITEGHFEKEGHGICIYQNKGKKADEIQELLDQEGLHYSKYLHKNGKSINFRIVSRDTIFYRHILNNLKELPPIVYNLSIKQKRLLIETMMKGDGHWQNINGGYYCTANRNLIEQFQLLSILAGWNVSIYKRQDTFGLVYYGSIIKNKFKMFRPKSIKQINYKGKIWCISTEHSNFLIRRNGQIVLSGNSKMLDMILLREAKQKGIILPSKHYGEGIEIEETFEGAYRRCETGLYKGLWKLDLSSAYPMAIINFCLDIANIKENEGITINKVNFYQNSNALLPTIAQKLINKKDILKKQLKALPPESTEAKDLQIKYDAIKAVVNSLFGVCGLKIFRLFDYRIAASITFLIRDLLHYIEDELKKRSVNVIYIDTDSVFIDANENPKDLCNELVKQWAKEKYNKDKIGIEFDLEGQFDKLFIIALCHYKGYLSTPKGVKEEIKGIESKRKDSSNFIREFQNNLLDMIMNEKSQEEIVKFINSEKERIKTLPLIDIGFPCRINAEKDYKSIPIFMRGLEYTKEIIPFNKVPGDAFYWIPVIPFGKAMRKSSRNQKNKETGEKEIKTSEKEVNKNILCFDEDQQQHIKEIDWKRVIDKSILDKCEHIFLALHWDLSLIKEVKIRKPRKNKNGTK